RNVEREETVALTNGGAKQNEDSGPKTAARGPPQAPPRGPPARATPRPPGRGAAPPIHTAPRGGRATTRPRPPTPLVHAHVARRILDAIESGTQQLILPRLSRFMPAARVLPVRAFDRVMDFFGINRTMDHFTGRPTSTSGTGPR